MDLIWCGANPEDYSNEIIGGKAKGLLELYNRQIPGVFSVPDFFIIPTNFFSDYITNNGLEDIIKIKDVKKINEIIYSTWDSYHPNLAPRSIDNKFDMFLDQYAHILKPALEKLSNVKEHNKVAKRNNKKLRKNPPTIEDFMKSMSATDEKDKNPLGLEELPPYHHLITRSASVLEQGEHFFDGVFLSCPETQHNEIRHYLSRVLSSSWSPFAMYCMQQSGIELNHNMAVIIQRHVWPEYSGQIIFTPERSDIKFNIQATMSITKYFLQADTSNIITKFSSEHRDINLVEKELMEITKKIRQSPLSDIDEGNKRQQQYYWETQKHLCKFDNDYASKLLALREYFQPDNNKIQLEFVVDKQNDIYLVQQRIKPLEQKINFLTKPTVSNADIVSDKLGCIMMLNECGPAINLLNYDGPETIEQLDEKYPNGIIIFSGTDSISDPAAEGAYRTRLREDFRPKDIGEVVQYVLTNTPKRKAIILPLTEERWNHLHDMAVDFKFPTLVYDYTEKNVVEALKSIKTGENINVWSNNSSTLIYKSK